MKRVIFSFIFIISLTIMLTGCGSSNKTNKVSSSISGVASLGLISGGTVTVYPLNGDGTTGDKLVTATTASDGTYKADIGSYRGNVLVEVTGGTYTDEATGQTVSNTETLRAALAEVTGSVSVAVTPMTEIAVLNAGTLTKDNIDKANSLVSTMIGVDIIKTMPADTSKASSSATVDETTYGLMLATISQMVKDGKATDVSGAINNIKQDLSDNKLDTTGGDLSSSLTNFLNNEKNKTGVDNMNLTKLDDSLQHIKENPITPVTDIPNLNKAKALVSDLRNTALAIYNYQGGASVGIVETPFKNLSEELQNKINPELADAVDRIGWVINSSFFVSPGDANIPFTSGSDTLTISISADRKSGNFEMKNGAGDIIGTGTITLNNADIITSGTLNATMTTKSGKDLVINLDYSGTFSNNIFTSVTFKGSITAPDFSFDFSQAGRELSATFTKNPNNPEFSGGILVDPFPTHIFFSGKVVTSTAQMEGKLDITSVWSSKHYPQWGDNTPGCKGAFVFKKGTFDGSFQELKNGSPTGVKFSGTITGKADNAEIFNNCIDESSTNVSKYSASFDGKIEAPSSPTIKTFLKLTHSEFQKDTMDVSYTKTNADGTVVFLSGSGTYDEGKDLSTWSLKNQDGMNVSITEDGTKSGDKQLSGTISTSGNTTMANLYTINNNPEVKYIDNTLDSIF